MPAKRRWLRKPPDSRASFGRCTTPFTGNKAWSKAPNARELFESYAGTIGLNMDQFKKDMDSDKARERVDSDHALGDSLGINVTPTMFINKRPMEPKTKTPRASALRSKRP